MQSLPHQRTSIPPLAWGLSLLALGAAALALRASPPPRPDIWSLPWLLATIPTFLLAYYRGWVGAAIGVAGAVAGLLLIQGLPTRAAGHRDDLASLVSLASTMAVGFGAGWITETLRRGRKQALDMAFADALTGLPNRRVVNFFLDRHFAIARMGPTFSIVMFDLDGFKRINDRLGHGAGDRALAEIGSILQRTTRRMDIIARYGGEEFIAILPGETVDGALVFAERMRGVIGEIRVLDGSTVSTSVGVAQFESTMTQPTELLDAADKALYEAKRSGGNVVRAHPTLA